MSGIKFLKSNDNLRPISKKQWLLAFLDFFSS
jgi:hypothetical protein